MKLRKNIIIILAAVIVMISTAVVFLRYQNNSIEKTFFDLKAINNNVDFKMVHLSDLHAKKFGKDNDILVEKVKEESPDFVVFTGDLLERLEDLEFSINTLKKIREFSKIYYIPGNHEYWSNVSETIFEKLIENDIDLLINKDAVENINGKNIGIVGLVENELDSEGREELINNTISKSDYTVALSHYPENFSLEYSYFNIDLVLSGHAHGGQFILPVIGGIYSPGQGFFPKYYNGLYNENNTNLIVNRGLGNSVIDQRLFNKPEIGIIDVNAR